MRKCEACGNAGGGEAWGRTGRLPRPGQYCFEALQVAVYQTGQYFMSHEVGRLGFDSSLSNPWISYIIFVSVIDVNV